LVKFILGPVGGLKARLSTPDLNRPSPPPYPKHKLQVSPNQE